MVSVDSIQTRSDFLKNCTEIKGGMKRLYEYPETGSPSDASLLDSIVKTEDVKIEIHHEDLDQHEYVQIKSEWNHHESDTYPSNSNEATFKNSGSGEISSGNSTVKYEPKQVLLKAEEDLSEYEISSKADSSKFQTGPTSRPSPPRQVKRERDPPDDSKHEDEQPAKIYRCGECDYETKHRRYLPKHLLRHRNPRQVPKYRCPACPYETNYKNNLVRHSLKHQDPALLKLHACPECDFTTKYRDSLPKHQLRHRDVPEVTLYGCDECDFRTKHKGYLPKHLLTHRSRSEVRMFKCGSCSYESIFSHTLNRHRLLQHKQNKGNSF